MKKNNSLLIIIFLLTAVVACKKVIEIDTLNSEKNIVIEGMVTNTLAPFVVKISTTVNYNSNNVFPTVSGALVKIIDSTTGITQTLIESPNGTYSTPSIMGVEGKTYLLQVTVNGKTYTASSKMPKKVLLDSVGFRITTGFGQTSANPIPFFQDPANINNYYRFIQSINSKITKKVFVFDDRLSDGRYVSRPMFNDSAYIQKFDTVQVEMQCIDKNVFNYFNQLEQLSDANGPQPANPTNPTSNIIGGALGYFSAHTIEKKKAVLKE